MRIVGSLGLVALVAFGAPVACKGAALDSPDAAPSPQAKAEPAPLANLTATASATATFASPDAGPPPEPLRSDRPSPADSLRESMRDSGTKELAGYSIQATLRTGEGPPAPKSPEVSFSAIEAAKRKTEAHMSIDASQTRARFALSGGFVLPQGTELRARVDRYGHLLMLPGENAYRVAEPGALRALFGERRLDVAPLSPAEITSTGDGTRRLNMRTRRVEISTRAAKATLELAALRDMGDGGVLVCRVLLDLMSAPLSTAACASDEVPLHAELRWTTQGALSFDVTSIARRIDIPSQDLATPPTSAAFVSGPPPASTGEALLGKSDLTSLRSAPVDAPPAAPRDAQAAPVELGLVLIDSSDELRVAWLDGVAVAWVAPGARMSLPSLVRGKYVLQWRTFLGDSWEPAETIFVPGTGQVGRADAGAR